MVRKGDVVLIQDASFRPASPATGEGAQLVLSPTGGQLPAAPIVLFRTLPRYSAILGDYVYRPGARGAVAAGDRGDMMEEDARLRPDLRLARSDPGMRRVADMARWCAEWVGGEAPL
ncbi:hypothetical protein Q8F55_000786 [Vanrija albida]|uniref:Uncharacterized protein n=1 Tax=Vanrija albida TaxID=181172 RepID=A0ABR3QEE2_9TREE